MIFKVFLLCCVSLLHAADFEGDSCTSNGAKGTCTLINKCPAALKELKSGKRPVTCGYSGTIPIVCCLQNTNLSPRPQGGSKPQSGPSKPPPVADDEYENRITGCEGVPESWTSKKTGRKAFDKCIEYQADFVYPCENVVALGGGVSRSRHCHHNVDQLIVGGNDTHKHEFPHMAMLGYGDSEQTITYNCGGSIISHRFVLTAGHCTYNTILGEPKVVLVGAYTRSEGNDASKVFKIKRIIKHPGYLPPSQYNDIGLLETEKKMPLSQFVVPACLHIGDPVSDEKILATGWGHTADRGNFSEIMQKVSLDKFTTEECSIKYPEYRLLLDGFDPQTQTCYGHKTKSVDTCQGDSGGPIQVKSLKVKCMYTVVGVTSFGRKCGLISEPAIYTKVSYYVPWIESIVWP